MKLDRIEALKKELSSKFIFAEKENITVYSKSGNALHHNMAKAMLRKFANGFSVVYRNKEPYLKIYTKEPIVNTKLISDYIGIENVIISHIGVINPYTVNRRRPAWLGCSVSHHDGYGSGSIGCVIKDGNDEYYIISNNHVLANANKASIGDEIIQPGEFDGGSLPMDRIGELSMFKKLRLNYRNSVDLAVAKLDSPEYVKPTIPKFGRLNGFSSPVEHAEVIKFGRETKGTHGVIESTSADIAIDYPNRGIMKFEDQIEIRSANRKLFSRPGDSGSVIVESSSLNVVGLLFSGAPDGTTFANNFNMVYNELNKYLPNFTIV